MNAAACYFVNGMESETSAIARGLLRRDPDLLDRLIEQYQHRLLRYLIHLTSNRELAEDRYAGGAEYSGVDPVNSRTTIDHPSLSAGCGFWYAACAPPTAGRVCVNRLLRRNL